MTDDAPLSAANEKKLAELREALDVAIAELEAGLGVEVDVDEFMAHVSREARLESWALAERGQQADEALGARITARRGRARRRSGVQTAARAGGQ